MGEHEGWPQPSGLLPNGLLPNVSTSVIRVLDSKRWSMAEERTAELITCIQPNQPSEERRNAVAEYVQQLIMKCFPCQVFTFGSVPLKTYLPDGDIDLTAFSKDLSLKDTWASHVRDMLESEEKNENAEFCVKEVQYIQAEVKIIKCLVENIVVDISFNQLGGLCTLCFLEEVDHLINQNHLFKRSIILIKAWCYYESRILGAHHGLISTYALETLVLYIFHVFNNSFAGPLEVLYRFLEFFSNFDWDNFCVSLWGPVPISSLPDVTAEPPRKDGGELLLSKLFLNACTYVYAVFPGGLENQGQPFSSKYFNVIDPLRVNNNLGRSVSKGNFYRIRSAFAFGAKRLARLLECPKENIVFELNQFFMNTWERHGSGIRPDAPIGDLWESRPSSQNHAFDNQWNASSCLKTDKFVKYKYPSVNEIEIEAVASSRSLSSQHDTYVVDSTSQSNDFSAIAQAQGQKGYISLNGAMMSDQTEKGNSNQSTQVGRNQRSWKPDQRVNEMQGRYLFARTRSSPELTDAYYDASSRRRNKPPESGKSQIASVKMEGGRRKNMTSETVSTFSTASSSDDPLSGRHSSSHHRLDVAADSNSVSGGYDDESGNGLIREGQGPAAVMGAQGMRQEEQDLVNLMASSSVHNFAGQIRMPVNLASTHLPLPISPSVLASMGYGQRTIAGMVPTNIPLIDPYWATNLQFHQGLVSSPLTQYFPGVGLSTNAEDLSAQGNKDIGSSEMVRGDVDTEYWRERGVASNGGFRIDDACSDFHSDERQPSTSANSNFIPSHRCSSGSLFEAQGRFTQESRGSTRDDYVETLQQPDNIVNEVHSDDRISSARFCSASQSGSVRSKTSSESSWDGSSARISKAAKDKRGRKTVRSVVAPSSVHGKGKNVYEHATTEADDEYRDWNTMATMQNEIEERSTSSQSASAMHGSNHNLPGSEVILTSGTDSVVPIAPMLLGPASRQRSMDNSGVVPFAFYPTGPPVPFLTMLPMYNFPTDSGTSDPSSSNVGGQEGPDDSDSGQNFDLSEGYNAPEVLNAYSPMRKATAIESAEELKGDILNSDFASHWQNLQYGRLCQSSRYPAPAICPSPVVVPPMYLQGRFPWDGPGRPVATNMNLFSHLINYGPHLVPVTPLQSMSNRPTAVYQQYVDEPPRYRSGTGTYLPNPKASIRDRHASGTRRNSYNSYDRSDHADREGNWNAAKARAAARNHSRNQAEKSRVDRLAPSENRGGRPWVRHEPLSSYQSQNGPLQPGSSQSSSAPMAYGMYPLPGMSSSGVMSNGPTVPSVVMLCSYDHNSGYVSPGEQLEFGSLGPVGLVVMNDAAQPADGTRVRGPFVEQRHHGSSIQHSSPDQPSSPHFQRQVLSLPLFLSILSVCIRIARDSIGL
ncbi:hypothetical protein Cgig2_031083 [Carnegiea gigantea]|uniref:Polymerase nucleotidyl transferase domain-containing protein n=1 Tax=Carnegiea gigantea TaxID=171969 RepID=A0A9Q1KAW7_9CARY|nr:hypothetical protein Cgig2_031083 [Carnegiea gigantea]